MRALRSKTGVLCTSLAAFAALAVSITFSPVRGDDKPSSADSSAQRSEEMKKLVAPLRAAKTDGATRVPLTLNEEPLQRWNDPTREFSDGSLWLWTADGRPVAAVAVELYKSRDLGAHWSFEFVSLTTGRVEAEADSGFDVVWSDLAPPRPDGKLFWTPKAAGLAFKPLPDAPAPGKTDAARLRQMKSQAQRFFGDELYEPTNRTYALRLLPHHAYRYTNPRAEVLDGAIFMLAHGTNPEILVLIELQGKDIESATWQYALARISRAAPTARLDQKVVWTMPHAYRPGPDEAYFIARQPRPAQTAAPVDAAKSPRSSR